MNSKEFKKTFNEIASTNSFERAFSGWFRESLECIVVIDLQKSNFGDYYDLNIKIFVQVMFGNLYVKGKDLVKKDTGDIFTRQPNSYGDVFNFDRSMEDDKRKLRSEKLFSEFINPFVEKALTRQGILGLATQETIVMLPAVKKELVK